MGKKILLVDDDKDYLELAGNRLREQGFEVITAYDGEEGFDKAREEKPDLIITDIKMPKADGFLFIKKVKEESALQNIPLIGITAYKDLEDMFKLEGVEHYVFKSRGLAALMEKVFESLGMEIQKKQGAKKKILVIEDDRDYNTLVAFELKQQGFEVITAYDGEEGFNKAREEKPDLIITDIKMPKLDGYSLLKKFKDDPVIQKIPLIVHTAYEHMQDMFHLEGVEHYILKTGDPQGLLKKIFEILGEGD